MKKILVAVDGYAASMGAAKKAVELAVQYDAELVVVRIEEEVVRHEYEREEEEANSVLHKISSRPLELISEYAKQQDLTVQTVKDSGMIAGTILKHADEVAADFIVVGDSARKGLDMIHFGSVATSIVSKANVPVIVVRSGIVDISDLESLSKQFTGEEKEQIVKPVFNEERYKNNLKLSFSLLAIFAVSYFGAAMLTTAEFKHIAIIDVAGVPLSVLLGILVLLVGLGSTQVYLKKSAENNHATNNPVTNHSINKGEG